MVMKTNTLFTSPDGSGCPLVQIPKLRDGTGDWNVQQDNIACEEKSLLLNLVHELKISDAFTP
jgi:hypothetical protein